MKNQTRPVTLLLVDDDELDVMGIERALAKLKIKNPLVKAHDGIVALEHLRGENGREKIEGPVLILLDLNMPRMNGIEFLDEIRGDPLLRKMIVFMLTTSSADEDKVKAYNHNVAGYIVKADPANSIRDAISLVDSYWTIVEFP
ncbi:MAG: response regulator [Pseudomonadota bacterium]